MVTTGTDRGSMGLRPRLPANASVRGSNRLGGAPLVISPGSNATGTPFLAVTCQACSGFCEYFHSDFTYILKVAKNAAPLFVLLSVAVFDQRGIAN